MRTLLEVKTEIAALRGECGVKDGKSGSTFITTSITKRKLSMNKKRIEFLQLVEKYLETSPDELYLGRDIKRIENRIALIQKEFNPEDYKDPKKASEEHEKKWGVPQLKIQLRTLRYIKK